MCNLLPCELSQRIRGFSTTMRYINRHYLSIYLSKTSFTLLPSCFSDSRRTACACRRKLNTSKAVTCFRTVDSLSRVLVICWTFTNIRSSIVRWLFDSLYPCGTWWMEQLIIVVGAMIRLQVFALCVGRKTYTQQLKCWRDTSKSWEVRWR